jgi:phospholipase C
LRYQWPLRGFGEGTAHFRLYGPNGFYREFVTDPKADVPEIVFAYEKERNNGRLTGNVVLRINNSTSRPVTILVTDHAYKVNTFEKAVNAQSVSQLVVKLDKSSGWYDFSVAIKGGGKFRKRYAGRVETGKETITDPFMGRVI